MAERCGLSELVLLKLGGSLLTDKARERTLRTDVCRRLGGEVREALAAADLRLLLGHGAGSFAHVPAARYRTAEGLPGGGGWRGCAETRRAVVELNARLLEAFAEAGFHPFLVSPWDAASARDGMLVEMDLRVIEALFAAGQTPMVCGDVVLDERLGFTIASTESIFECIARRLRPERVLLACDVDGLFTSDPAADPRARRIERIGPDDVAEMRRCAGGARGCDVTGGMAAKVAA